MSIFDTTTSMMPTLTATGSTNFALNEDGTVNKKNALTTLLPYVSTTSSNIYQENSYNAIIRKYSNAKVTEDYVSSLSDEELEVALLKLGLLEEEMDKDTVKYI